MNILIAEDDEMILRTLEYRLKQDGYNISVARDGNEAMEMIKKVAFNLIITDLMMPYVSGMEILSYVKSNFKGLPVVILSGADEENTVLDAFNIGADDFIAKPFSPGEVSVRVKRFIKNN